MEGETSWVSHCLDDIAREVVEFDSFSQVSDEGNKEVMAVSLDLVLPDDLLERILAYLPIASIFRAGCVCKRWYEIVTPMNLLVMPTIPSFESGTASNSPVLRHLIGSLLRLVA
ncbi:hypothetical protein CsSME_00012950 [Camellia sinensis var. sinensis]